MRRPIAVWILGMLLAATSGLADVVINEFLAVNRTNLVSNLGDPSDWIELYNTGPAAVSLNGWSLTDTPSLPRKWMFPYGTTLPAFGYLLVFADGMDGLINGQLHTTFSLDEKGEYLALVNAGGQVVSSYAPQYLPQTADVSFGIRPDTLAVDLIATNASFRYLVPLNGAVDAVWMTPGFQDAAWATGLPGIGYQKGTGVTNFNGLIRTTVSTETMDVYLRYKFVVTGKDRLLGLVLKARYDDGYAVFLNGVRVGSENAPATLTYASAATAERLNSEAMFYFDHDLGGALGQIVEGTNVLCVQVLNYSTNPRGSDLLFAPQLAGVMVLPGAGSETRYFHKPTPGRMNELGTADFLHPVQFTPRRGYYSQPFQMQLAASEPGCRIRYTLDGTVPTESQGVLYQGPVNVTTTTVVRARAFKSGYEPSDTVTHSYFFIADILRQPTMNVGVVLHPDLGPKLTNALISIRTLSLVTPRDNLFGPINGIYTHPLSEGDAWERPVSIEWVDPDQGEETQVNCGVRIYGGFSRQTSPQKSFRLIFRRKYGPGQMDYDVFRDQPAAKSFETLILRAGFSDPATVCGAVDPFVRKTQLAVSGYGSRSTYVHLFINGQYWGVYNPSERQDQSFGAAYFGGLKEEWDAVNAGEGIGYDIVTWLTMKNTVAQGLANNAAYQKIQGRNPDGTFNTSFQNLLDVVNHADYMMTHLWCGTGDWPIHNWYANCGSRLPTGCNGWKFFVWDAEISLNLGTSLGANVTGTAGPEGIHGALRQSSEYRLLFADRIRKAMFNGGALTTEACSTRFAALAGALQTAHIASIARWGSVANEESWEARRQDILANYLPQRPAVMLGQFRQCGLYPAIDAPDFSPHGGVFTNGFRLAITGPGTIYYTLDGTDPRQCGTGAARGLTYRQPLTLDSTVCVKARSLDAQGVWSAQTEANFIHDRVPACVRISEVMYHPYPPPTGGVYTASDFEFVELVNTGASPVNLRQMQFAEGVRFTFPAQSLPAGGYAVVVANPAAFATRYDTNTIRVLGAYEGGLDDKGERLRLLASPDGPEIASFAYGDGRGWPLAADGAGHSLVPLVVDAQADGRLDCGVNWRPSAYRGGSPGRGDPAPVRDAVLNEFLAHTDLPTGTWTNPATGDVYDSNDWIEMYNAGQTPVTSTHWFLSDSAGDLKKWGFPAGQVLAPGQRAVFDEITGFHSPLSTGFGLSKDGEQLFLSYLPGTTNDRVADCVAFKAQERDVSLGRSPDGAASWRPLSPTPATANTASGQDVVISEVMYNSALSVQRIGGDGIAEYVEIYNPRTTAVPLWNSAGTWRLDGGVKYSFPSNTTLRAEGYLLIVPFDPVREPDKLNGFFEIYALTQGQVRVVGPYEGRLSNGGERIALERPQFGDSSDVPVAWVVVDEVVYADRAPWPVAADGTGFPIKRIANDAPGNSPANWTDDFTPTPGLPGAKVAITSPQNDATLFLPFSESIHVAIDDKQVVGAIQSVIFLEGTNVLAVDSLAPYSCVWQRTSGSGVYRLSARLADGAGVCTSTAFTVNALLLDQTEGVTERTDSTARLHARLQGSGTADLTLYYGSTDGGTNAGHWEQSVWVGASGVGSFSRGVHGLLPDRGYFYRYMGRTAQGAEGWSAASTAFRTRPYRDWARRMRVRFDGYRKSTVLTNFPALLVLGPDTPGFSYSDFSFTDGRDLRFADASQSVPLAYEIDSWDTGGESRVWVRIPELRASNTLIYAYWGLPDAATVPQSSLNGEAWRNVFRTVLHFQGTLKDSSGQGTEALDRDVSTVTSGMIGAGRHFDGTNDALSLNLHPRWIGGNLHNLSLSVWARPSGIGSPLGIDNAVVTNRLFIRIGSRGWGFVVSTAPAPLSIHNADMGAWQQLVMVLDHNLAYGYWNDAAPVLLGAYPDFEPQDGLMLGDKSGISEPFAGDLDEVRISPVAQSRDWVWASYRTVASNRSFCTSEMAPIQAAPPVVNNGDGAADIRVLSATLTGRLLSDGDLPAAVSVYWGPADGGADRAGWARHWAFGQSAPGAVAVRVTGLEPATRYYYRIYASNAVSETWASQPATFATVGIEPDRDADGMADGWEVQRFGATNAASGAALGDPDHDGLVNRDEYVAGTDPLNGTNGFFVSTEMLSGGVARVWFETVRTTESNYQGLVRYYRLERKPALTSPGWVGMESLTNLPASGQPVSCTNVPVSGQPQFYRGQVRLVVE